MMYDVLSEVGIVVIFVMELQVLRGSPVMMRKKSGNQTLRTRKTRGGQELDL